MVRAFIAGEVNREAAPALLSCTLIPVLKPNGSIRPIAMPLVLMRFVSKVALLATVVEASGLLQPFQLAVGTSNASEIMVRAARAAIAQINEGVDDPSDQIILFDIDIKNAFPSISRQQLFAQVLARAPPLARWVHWCYEGPSDMLYRDNVIEMRKGGRQGDPLFPLLFCLAFQLVPEALQAGDIAPLVLLQQWYADGGNIVCRRRDAERILTAALVPIYACLRWRWAGLSASPPMRCSSRKSLLTGLVACRMSCQRTRSLL